MSDLGRTWRKFDSPRGLFLVISREVDGTVDRVPFHGPHLDWLNQGHDSGHILLSGPSHDRALGIYVVRGTNEENVRQFVNSDPYHREGIRTFDLIEWEMQRRSLLPGLADHADLT
jgi:uncharacterized protein YciI